LVGITPESPIAAVFGRSTKKRDAVIKGLGLETVGELLGHFPRRYVKTTELSEVAKPHEGQLLSVVGRVTASEIKPFTNRQTRRLSYRVEVRVETNGPTFSISFFIPHLRMADGLHRQMAVGNRGMFTGKAKIFGRTWQLGQPHAVMFSADGE
jgi:ATP-dependent DNA helicase RecG